MAKKTKSIKKPFWKKLDPELKHIATHIGKIIDNTNLSQIQDFILNIGLAYAGYELAQDWRGALVGPVGLKLAESGNAASGAAGVAALTALGFASIVTHLKQTVPVIVGPDGGSSCPQGYLFTVMPDGTQLCVISPSGLY